MKAGHRNSVDFLAGSVERLVVLVQKLDLVSYRENLVTEEVLNGIKDFRRHILEVDKREKVDILQNLGRIGGESTLLLCEKISYQSCELAKFERRTSRRRREVRNTSNLVLSVVLGLAKVIVSLAVFTRRRVDPRDPGIRDTYSGSTSNRFQRFAGGLCESDEYLRRPKDMKRKTYGVSLLLRNLVAGVLARGVNGAGQPALDDLKKVS